MRNSRSKKTTNPGRLSFVLTVLNRMMTRTTLLLLLCTASVIGCSDNPGGELVLNQPDGLQLPVPEFLTARAINESNLEPRVSVQTNGGASIPVTVQQLRPVWIGDVLVPEGSDVELLIEWFETGISDLPDELNGELKLASFSSALSTVDQNQAIEIATEDYVVESTEASPRPDLDIDNDGAGNLAERISGSRSNDPADTPSVVTILFNDRAPVIDGQYDAIWNNAQFLDQNRNPLAIDKVLIDFNVIQDDEDRQYKWAGMHDGTYLYLMIFGEAGAQQTPFGDSDFAFDDDAIDIFLDGNNSKRAGYDGVDDFHAIIALLSKNGAGTPNFSGSLETRFELGDRSTPINGTAFDFAVCLCTGEQQLWEVRINLAEARIPVDQTFGFEIQLNNDVDGGTRDAKWAWFDESGEDSTWRFPSKMGTARLEQPPF